MTARTKCGLVKPMECCELLHGRRIPLKLKGSAYKLCKASNAAWK